MRSKVERRAGRAPAAEVERSAARAANQPPTARMLEMQRRVGNQAVLGLMGAARPQPSIQRSYTTLPVAFVGNDPTTAPTLLKQYLGSAPVATGGLTFVAELDRIRKALTALQPSKAKEMDDKRKEVVLKKTPAEAIADAARLEPYVNYLNGLVATYQLDTAPAAVSGRVEETEGHHMTYQFRLPGDVSEKAFDLDTWSRKGANLLQGGFSGATIAGIVNEAVDDWDPTRGSIIPLLNQRLLGSSGALGGSGAAALNVPAVFMSSPVGANYVKILAAADHILGVRTRDLKPRGVVVDHWVRTKPAEKDNTSNRTIDWPLLLGTARTALKAVMKTTEVADQTRAGQIGLGAIAATAAIRDLVGFGVLSVDATSETFALVYGPKRNGNDVYEAMRDDKFKFDLNHFTAILFFEWKAVSDLKRQS